eukprot:1076350-Prorocentrum_lima.AAC.1
MLWLQFPSFPYCPFLYVPVFPYPGSFHPFLFLSKTLRHRLLWSLDHVLDFSVLRAASTSSGLSLK